MSHHGSFTPLSSVFSSKPTTRLELQEPMPEPNDESKTVIAPQLKLEIPTVGSDHGDRSSDVNSVNPVESLRVPSFEGHSGAEFTEILSPTPERSIASPASRNRFSKILSIDEGLSEFDGLVNPQKAGCPANSPSQVSRTSSFRHSNVEHPWPQRTSFSLNCQLLK